MFLRLVKELAEKENVTEELKSTDQKFKAIGPYAAKRQVKIIKKSLTEKKK